MKKNNLKILKIALFTLFILFISAISNNNYAYQIKTKVVNKESLNDYGRTDFPEMLYRKQTAAYETTASNYTNGTYVKDAAGWVYASTLGGNKIDEEKKNTGHVQWYTFDRIYEYFHEYQNSNYRLEPASGYIARKYSTREITTTNTPSITTEGTGTYYNIWSETGNYAGVWNAPLTPDNISANIELSVNTSNSDIVIMETNLYRFAVIAPNNTYLSDNSFTQETKERIWEKFGEANYSKTFTVYNSSVLNTGSANGKYYDYMDTAYKFLQTTLYGNTSWGASVTLTGGSNGESSFVNYYDNTFEFSKGNSKKIYVRHIDVSGMGTLTAANVANKMISRDKTKNGQIIEICDWVDDVPVFLKYHRRTKPGDDLYTDFYDIPSNHGVSYFVGNMRYTNEYYNSDKITKRNVSSLDVAGGLTTRENEILNTYKCVGYTVGKGASLEIAAANRDSNINKIGHKDNLTGNDWTNTIVSSGEQDDYIVIDFYYDKPVQKKVYVRHVNLTDYAGKVTKSNVDRCIQNGKTLSAPHITIETNGTRIYPSTAPSGYNGMYSVNSGQKIIAEPNNDNQYECIGTNITSSNVNLTDAKIKMDDRLLGNPACNTPGGDVSFTVNADVYIVDFYYKKKEEETVPDPIIREPIGRLSYYTTSPTDSNDFYGVNDNNTSNNKLVIDTIASGESLRPSINGAYRYMLAGINIEERKDENPNHYLTYTINQPFRVYCRDGKTTLEAYEEEYTYTRCGNEDCWDEERTFYCNSKTLTGGIDDNAYCLKHYKWYSDPDGAEYSYHDLGDHQSTYEDREFHRLSFSDYDDDEIDDFDGKLNYRGYTWDGSEGILNLKVEYKVEIPYICTYYKIKNIRTYTISKLELLDGYSNAALPLFDGNTHIFYTSDAYKDLFENGYYSDAKFNSSLNRSSITLPTLNVYYNNIDDPIEITTTYRYDRDEGENFYDIELDTSSTRSNMQYLADLIDDTGIKDKLEDMDISDVAKLSGLETKTVNKDSVESGEIEIGTTMEIKKEKAALTATLELYNDRLSLNNGNIVVGKYTSNPNDIKTNEEVSYGITKKTQTEYSAQIKIDLSKYSNQTINLSTVYPKSIRGTEEDAIGSQYLPSSVLTQKSDFKSTDENGITLTIPASSLNGKRYSYAKAYYSIDENYKLVNYDVSSVSVNSSSYNSSTFSRTYKGNKRYNKIDTEVFNDTEMFNTTGVVGSQTTKIDSSTLGEIVWEYGANNTFEKVQKNPTSSSKDADIVDVFTPVAFSTKVLQTARTETEGYVNHTDADNSNQIQKNARFTIQLNASSYTYGPPSYSSVSTNKYLKEYYIKFNFDVQDIIFHDARASSEGRRYESGAVPKETWIGPIYNLNEDGTPSGTVSVSAFALADANAANGLVDQEENTYTVRAVAYNVPPVLMYDLNIGNISTTKVATFVTLDSNKNEYTSNYKQSHQNYYSRADILGHNRYVAEKEYTTTNLSRIYDFKVTDLKDIDWKNIFRKSTSANTNVHTSKAYYSGIYKWNIYTTKVSEMVTRDVSEIGTTQQQILPLGPYKHTNSTYTNAPKLGYKFSFDLKTTGANANKKIIIEPEFYYVGKDGSGYTKNIRLFYKNSSNKYVPIENYNIYFVPDDGYRLTFEGTDAAYRFDDSLLTKSTVKLGNTKLLTLKKNMMETADQAFVQIWYGEYKLPNSTIAVKVNPSDPKDYNINKKLTDGYIGVIFKIKVEEYSNANLSGSPTRTISYSQNDKNPNGSNENTSQWDYEGYLGIKEVGKEIADPSASASANIGKQRISIKLEKGEWQLDNNTYNDIKGTVILYDTDAKASSDYD